MTGVREVCSRADLRRFIEYLFAKYGKDLRRVPPSLVGKRADFDPKKNLFQALHHHLDRSTQCCGFEKLYTRMLAYKGNFGAKPLFHKHAWINHVIEAGGAKRHKTYQPYQKEI